MLNTTIMINFREWISKKQMLTMNENLIIARLQALKKYPDYSPFVVKLVEIYGIISINGWELIHRAETNEYYRIRYDKCIDNIQLNKLILEKGILYEQVVYSFGRKINKKVKIANIN